MSCPHPVQFDNIINLRTNNNSIVLSLTKSANRIKKSKIRIFFILQCFCLQTGLFYQNYQFMYSDKRSRYTQKINTQPPESNASYTRQFQQYTQMLNRLNQQNQSLSMSVMGLISQNKALKKQLHQKRLEQLMNKQYSGQLRSPSRYISRYNNSTNTIEKIIDQRHSQIQQRSKNHSIYLSDNKNKKGKYSSVLKSGTMIEQLSQQKFSTQRKKGLYLSKQISKASEPKKSANLQSADQIEKKQQQTNPQSPQKQSETENAMEKNGQPKKPSNFVKKTNSPYKVQLMRVNCRSPPNFSQSRKDHLESMYSYLYSPVKTYNQIAYDKP